VIRRLALPLLVVLALVAAGCGTTTPSPTTAPSAGVTSGPPMTPAPGGPAELQVYAASSLKNVLVKLAEAYETANPGITLAVSTDASSALETKIEQGAPADVFLSADTKNPQKLVDGGFAAGDVRIFAGNQLAIITPADNPKGITAPLGLAKAGVKIIAAADGVPITTYTTQLLDGLAKLETYPDDFAARYAANVVSKEDNVGGIVAKVALGEGDAGVVYLTDAKAAKDVTVIAIPSEFNVAASYGAVAVKDAAHAAAADAFLAWLTSPEAQAILASFGFLQVA
jgi:molybdate transport system substrate-binding protein